MLAAGWVTLGPLAPLARPPGLALALAADGVARAVAVAAVQAAERHAARGAAVHVALARAVDAPAAAGARRLPRRRRAVFDTGALVTSY